MKYYQPESLSQAAELLTSEDGAKVIAGGQSMMPLLRQDLASPGALVDITRIEELATGVTVTEDVVDIGALVTYSDLLAHDVCEEMGLLRDALDAIGDRQVRNAGTIGGGVAHADPAQDLPPALQCYGTEVVVFDGEAEQVYDINDFFVDFYFTALAPNEIITRVSVNRPPPDAGGAFAKHARTPGGFSEAGVAALVIPTDDGDAYADVRVAYCAGAPVPRRVPDAVEADLVGTITRADVETAADAIVESLDNVGDVGDYDEAFNEHIFRVLTKRAITTAVERSEGPEVEP